MPKIDRREFVKLVGTGGVGVGAGFMLAESIKHPVEFLIPYPVPPEDFSAGIATWYNTVCGMCSAGCGISVRTREGRAKKIEGNPVHPVSQGRLCSLGQAGLQDLYNPDRITSPRVLSGERGSGVFQQTSWEEGLAQVAQGIRHLQSTDQVDSICMITGGVRGHLATVMEVFMEQLGSTRLHHLDFTHPHTLFTANRQFFGEEQLPYYDIENTRFLLSFGADYLGSWISPVHHGLGFGRSRQAHEHRGHFVQIEPRMSLSGAAADEWIPANPGTEGILALGMAHHIVSQAGYQGSDRDAWTAALADYSPARIADRTGVDARGIESLAERFAASSASLAIGGGAAAHHSNGVATLTAVNALNYLAGSLGRAGGLVLNPEPALASGSSSRQAGYQTMAALAEEARQGKIQILILCDADPVFSLPSAAGVADALAEVPLIVSLSRFLDDSSIHADVILPSHSYLESWGDDAPDAGVGFPLAAVSQPVVSPLFDTRATGDILLQLGQRLGFQEALPWMSMEECIKDGWRRIHERGGGSGQGDEYERFWVEVLEAGVWGEKVRRDQEGFSLDAAVIEDIGVDDPQFAGDSDEYPFILHPYLTTDLRDGRGANLPWLQELPDPLTSVVYGSWVEMNPLTADELGYSDGDLVEVTSTSGSIRAPVYVYPAIMPGVIAMPIGQGHGEFGRYARGRGANPIQILAPQLDGQSGDLAWAATRVNLVPTGERLNLVRTGGTSRQLGRGIVQTTGGHEGGGHGGEEHSARLNSIPITVEPA